MPAHRVSPERPSQAPRRPRRALPPFLTGVFLALAVAAVATLLLTGPHHWSTALAQGPLSFGDLGNRTGLPSTDLRLVLVNVIRWALGILGVVAVSFIVYGGVLWMTARGDEKRVLKAKKVIVSALIGLVIVLLSFAIVSFVARSLDDSTSTGGGGGPPTGCIGSPLNCLGSFEIRSITTSCANPPNFREDVSRCSAVVVTFNNRVDTGTVAAALNTATPSNDRLIIEECADENCTPLDPARAPVDTQPFEPSGTPRPNESSWVVPAPGKSVAFYHPQELFPEPAAPATRTSYRLKIPKTLTDGTNNLAHCRRNSLNPIPGGGCVDQGDYFEWIFWVGTSVDTTPPQITQTYPDSSYRTVSARDPDRQVPRVAILTVRLSEAIDQTSFPGSVVLKEVTEPTDIPSGTDYSEVATIDPAHYSVIPDGDNQTLGIQLFPGSVAPPAPPFLFKPFTWYEVTVQNLRDLCSNTQDPNPYTWVFETNDVTPGVASVSPPNEYAFACPDVPIQIDYTVSMYDPIRSGCLVDPTQTAANGGFVKEGRLSAPDGGRALQVVPGDEYPGWPENPNNYCKRYAFQPNNDLTINTHYQVGVNTGFLLDDQGNTLNYGDLPLADPSPLRSDWHFDVAAPGQCANPPHIDRLDPVAGPRGQCFSIQGFGFTPTQAGADEIRFGNNAIPPQPGGWTDRNIVTTAPSSEPVGSYPVKVRIDHGGAIGVLESNPATFAINSTDLSDGPCLVTLNPDTGPWNTRVDLSGTRFRNFTPGSSRVRFSGSAELDPGDGERVMSFPGPGAWSDTAVRDALVAPNSFDGIVRVENALGQSNGIPFDVTPPLPSVANAWPSGCTQTCVNAGLGARFNLPMDGSSFTTTTVALQRCTDNDCTTLDSTNLVTGVSYVPAPDSQITIGHDPLSPDTPHRAILRGGPTGVKSAIGEPLWAGNLNYDSDGTGGPDSYSWWFRTRDDAAACAVATVTLAPATATARIGQPVDFRAEARSAGDSCGPAGQRLTPAWSWAITGTAIALNDDPIPLPSGDGTPDPHAIATGNAATPGETITATAESHSATSTMIVSADPAFCFDDSQCVTNEIGAACSGSTCVSNRCTPVITDVDPNTGPVGQGVTIRGCWFGNYVAGQSAVFFHDNVEADVPTNAACGGASGTWHNDEVIRLVPAGALDPTGPGDGPVRLTRDDGSADTTDGGPGPVLLDFDVRSGDPGPYLCALQPAVGSVGDAVTLQGGNLDRAGDGRTVGTDQVAFHDAVDVTSYNSWADASVGVNVPTGAADGLVRATTANGTSNGLTFDVRDASGPGSCSNSCSVDNDCGFNEGCSASGCCAPQPRVTATSPLDGATNVCRNVIITATVAGAPLNPTTVSTATVSMVRVSCPAEGAVPATPIPVAASATATSIRVIPTTLLPVSQCFAVTLENSIRSRAGVRLGGLNADADQDGTPDALRWQFGIGTEVCLVDQVRVDPNAYTFTSLAPGQDTAPFSARAYSRDLEVNRVPGIVDWTWGWSLSDTNPVSLLTPTDQQTVTVQARQEGQSLLTATATGTAGFTGTRKGSAALRVLACDNPWSLADPTTNTFHDSNAFVETLAHNPSFDVTDLGNISAQYNFSLTYCRGRNGTSLLPDFSKAFVRGPSDNRRKEFLFKEPSAGAKDGIGLLVFENPEGLSPQDWLEREQPGEGSGGRSTVVDGYPAYQLGSTTYVAARQLDNTDVTCPAEVENGGFESWTGSHVDNWNDPTDDRDPRRDTVERAPLSSGASSVTMDASTEVGDRQWYLVQPISSPTDTRRYSVSGWVRARRVRAVAAATRNAAGLITQCNPFNGCEASSFLTGYDRFTVAQGLFSGRDVGFDSGWQRIGFPVSNPNAIPVGLQLNCFAEPGWQVWCDDVSVQETTSSCLGSLNQNIFVLSYNSDATEPTKAIVGQLLRSWELNVNPNLTAEDRAAIARDTQRLGDLRRVNRALTDRSARGQPFPDLAGGTFVPSVSISRWESWTNAFASGLGITPPTDPLNVFDPPCVAAGPFQPEAATCWSEANRQFICPSGSRVYGYRYGLNGPGTYTLGANLEYTGLGSQASAPVDLCASLPNAACQCFNYTINSP